MACTLGNFAWLAVNAPLEVELTRGLANERNDKIFDFLAGRKDIIVL